VEKYGCACKVYGLLETKNFLAPPTKAFSHSASTYYILITDFQETTLLHFIPPPDIKYSILLHFVKKKIRSIFFLILCHQLSRAVTQDLSAERKNGTASKNEAVPSIKMIGSK